MVLINLSGYSFGRLATIITFAFTIFDPKGIGLLVSVLAFYFIR